MTCRTKSVESVTPTHHTSHLTHHPFSHHTSHLLHHSTTSYHATCHSHITQHLSHALSQPYHTALITWLSCGRRSTQSRLAELRREWSPPGPRLAFVWQAQHTEPAARVVATWPSAGFRVANPAHRAFWRSCCARGRRLAAWPAAGFRVAGAAHRAFWRSCGARGRRLARGWLLCGTRSTQSLLEELRRAWSPPGPWLAFVWQVQHTELSEPASRRLVRGWLSCGRRITQSLLEELRRAWPPLGPRLAFMWLHRASAARVAAAWAAPGFRVTGAVHIASWRSCARGRRWAAAGFHLISSHLISSLSPSLA